MNDAQECDDAEWFNLAILQNIVETTKYGHQRQKYNTCIQAMMHETV